MEPGVVFSDPPGLIVKPQAEMKSRWWVQDVSLGKGNS